MATAPTYAARPPQPAGRLNPCILPGASANMPAGGPLGVLPLEDPGQGHLPAAMRRDWLVVIYTASYPPLAYRQRTCQMVQSAPGSRERYPWGSESKPSPEVARPGRWRHYLREIRETRCESALPDGSGPDHAQNAAHFLADLPGVGLTSNRGRHQKSPLLSTWLFWPGVYDRPEPE